MKKQVILLLLLVPVFFASCKRSSTKAEDTYLVVLSMDGIRWDYNQKANTPTLDSLAAAGVKAERMIPSFPTKTFPNHYTLATGLYPDHHGIVLNHFYDPEQQRYYRMKDPVARDDGTFYGGEPVWNTAQKQGLRAATLFWVGSEADVQGQHPDIWKPYEHKMPYTARIDTVLAWLQLPESQRPQLVMWYVDEPDGCGHTFGPDSPQLVETVEHLDSLLGIFMRGISRLPHHDKINVIVLSDHGMGEIDGSRAVVLADYIDTTWIAEAQGGNPVWTLQAADGFHDSVAAALAKVPHITWWASGEMPERLHYGTNPRTLDFVVAADSSWSVGYKTAGSYYRGTHGYDNANADMHTIFYAAGPAFRNDGFVNPPFANVSVYPLMCKILGIEPAPNDGNIEEVAGMLK
jgi:alkaline phosphatase D